MNKKFAISLFSSSGIGDIALKKSKYNVLVANELLEDRSKLYKLNFPETEMITGDIWIKKEEIIKTTKKIVRNNKLDLALVSPPCQGMSKNGRGKLLSEIKAGRRPKEDPRNALIIPAIEIISSLKPETIVFENVIEMKNTLISINKKALLITDYIKEKLPEYIVDVNEVNFADYGVPQNRKRLITIVTNNKKLINFYNKFGTLIPETTHSKQGKDKKKWISVKDKIFGLEKLDGKSKLRSENDPLHKIVKLDDRKYWWVSNTPSNESAFNNQCINCNYKENLRHTSKKNSSGVNTSSKNTPIYCSKCKSLLPRPTTIKNNIVKLMKGFTSAYKRMSWSEPASTITRNFPYVCSDNKIHPQQHRALSYREACILHTIEKQDFKFIDDSKNQTNDVLIRDTLGESIPPKFLETLLEFFEKIEKKKITFKIPKQQKFLFTQSLN